MATTWNPSDETGAVTLSNGNLTAAFASGPSGVRTTGTARTSGKWYFEFSCSGTTYFAVGVAEPGGLPLSEIYNSVAKGSFMQDESGQHRFYQPGADTPHKGINGTGGPGLYAIAVDIDSKIMGYRFNGGAWFYESVAHMASFAPAACQLLHGGATVTANFGATAFTYAVPDGYSAWDSVAITDDQSII